MLCKACKLIVLLSALLVSGVQALASSTATISVGGAETGGDTATISVVFNGFVETVRYGAASTPASIASAFAAMFSRDYLQDGLCASATGSLITFKLKGDSTFGSLGITGSTASFHLTSSGFASAGTQAADFGTVTLSINGSVISSADYGADSTPATIAETLAESASSSLVNVTASGSTLQLDATAAGAASDSITYSVANAGWDETDFTQPSFPSAPISGQLAGGVNQSTGTASQVYNFQGSYDGAGNVTGYVDSVMGSWTFAVDTLNRLVSAQNITTTSTSAQYANNHGCWNYDQFGNRLSQSMSTTPCGSNPPLSSWAQYNGTVNGTNNNQMSQTSQNALQASGYDASGDVTSDGVNQYLYDAEGRICAVAGTPTPGVTTMTGYLYDADGTRVAKGTITAWSCDPATSGLATTTDYVLGSGGEQVTEMSVSGSTSTWSHTNVWAGGKLLATYDKTGKGLHFYLDDPLGTRRAQTDYLGVLEQTCASLPFGDGLACSGSVTTPTEHHFTGKERDSESGNDYFEARYYSSAMGRFMSPDWSAKEEPVPYATMDDPQSLNLYAYVRNNPLARTDPDGHCGMGNYYDCGLVLQAVGNALFDQLRQFKRNTDATMAERDGLGPLKVAAEGAVISTTLAMGAEAPPEEVGVRTDAAEAEAAGVAESAAARTSEVPTSIPAGPTPTPTKAQQTAINEMMDAHGCVDCGTKVPGTKSGNAIGNHNPAKSVNPPGGPQTYTPHCLRCSLREGGRMRAAQAKAAAAAKKAATPQ